MKGVDWIIVNRVLIGYLIFNLILFGGLTAVVLWIVW